MEDINLHKISLDQLSLPQTETRNVKITLLRLDKIHPQISGNKWFKLRYWLEDAKQQHKKTIVTAGGAWSGHILATAAACQLIDLASIGIIRGEKPAVLSPLLQEASALGMELVFISQENFDNERFPDELNNDENYFIPRGGFGNKGAEGAAGILDHCVKENYTHIFCAVGTGTMLAGLTRAVSAQLITGISIFKNNHSLEEEIKSLTLNSRSRFRLIHDYHFGGFAKYQPALIHLMNEFYRQTGIPTDFVYTGKLCFAVMDLLEKSYFEPGSRILVIHSGGLAGNASLKKGTLIF